MAIKKKLSIHLLLLEGSSGAGKEGSVLAKAVTDRYAALRKICRRSRAIGILIILESHRFTSK